MNAEHSCCCAERENKRDILMIISSLIIAAMYIIHYLSADAVGGIPYLSQFAESTVSLVNQMLPGLAAGIFFVGLLHDVPREIIAGLLGPGGKVSGIMRAAAAGVFLDLCSHGILLIAMQLYKRGASLGQVMAFLIASPWNSFSLTFILISLIGSFWTGMFIILSFIIAAISGIIFEKLVARGVLPSNQNSIDLPENYNLRSEIMKSVKSQHFGISYFMNSVITGLKESGMIIRWLFAGAILAAILRTLMTHEMFGDYFGPSVTGLAVTLGIATILEVCSEGSSPIAADILTRANAPGNAFTFLMAGIATDYTEIMGLKETTKSWKTALFLPLVTVPQILIIGYILNMTGR